MNTPSILSCALQELFISYCTAAGRWYSGSISRHSQPSRTSRSRYRRQSPPVPPVRCSRFCVGSVAVYLYITRETILCWTRQSTSPSFYGQYWAIDHVSPVTLLTGRSQSGTRSHMLLVWKTILELGDANIDEQTKVTDGRIFITFQNIYLMMIKIDGISCLPKK